MVRTLRRLTTLGIILLAVIVLNLRRQPVRAVTTQSRVGGSIVDVFRVKASRYGLDWRLLFAMAWKESNFRTNARGAAGEKGMAQFMPGTWAMFGRGDPDDPNDAIEAQARYLAYIRHHLAARGITDPRMMVAGYNCGQGCAASCGRVENLSPQVQAYVADVWNRYTYLAKYWR